MARITISIRGGVASVSAAYRGLVEPVLQYPAYTFAASENGQIEHRREVQNVYAIASAVVEFAAGSVPRVARALQSLGHAVEIERMPVMIDTPYDPELRSICAQELPGLLEALIHRGALLDVGRNSDRIRIVGRICRLLPTARILVPAATLEEVGDNLVALSGCLESNVDGVHLGDWRSPARVVCCTFRSWETSSPADWNIVLVPRAEQSVSSVGQRNIIDYAGRQRIGLVRRFGALGIRTQLTLEAAFGPCFDPRGSRPTILPAVHFATPPLATGVNDRSADPTQSHRLTWARNDYIARLATACTAGDHSALYQCGVFVAGQFARVPVSTAIVVETWAHAMALAELLPHFRLVPERAPDPEDRSVCSWIERSIFTLRAARRHRRLNQDVIISAIMQASALPEIGRRVLAAANQTSPILIDIVDDHEDSVRAVTRARYEHYGQRGWVIAAAPPWLRQPLSDDTHSRSPRGRRRRRN